MAAATVSFARSPTRVSRFLTPGTRPTRNTRGCFLLCSASFWNVGGRVAALLSNGRPSTFLAGRSDSPVGRSPSPFGLTPRGCSGVSCGWKMSRRRFVTLYRRILARNAGRASPRRSRRSRRYGTPLCLLVFDIDYFKSVNDAFGHARGDAVLQEVVTRVHDAVRSSDILFRFGGDEFVLLLPNTQRDAGAHVGQRILKAISAEPFEGDPPLSTSVSIGLAIFPEDGQSAKSLFDAADHRNYQAKRRGRACLVADGPTTPSDHPAQEASRLIEREESIVRVQRFLDQVRSRARGVLRISGDRGTGRTRFLAEVVAWARIRSFAVFRFVVRPGRSCVLGAWLEGTPAELALTGAWNRSLDSMPSQPTCAKEGQVGLLIVADDLPDFDFSTYELLAQLVSDNGIKADQFPRRGLHDRARAVLGRFLKTPVLLHELVELAPLSRDGTLAWLRSCTPLGCSANLRRLAPSGTSGAPSEPHQASPAPPSRAESSCGDSPARESASSTRSTPRLPPARKSVQLSLSAPTRWPLDIGGLHRQGWRTDEHQRSARPEPPRVDRRSTRVGQDASGTPSGACPSR